MAEEMENEATASKNKPRKNASKKDPEFVKRHNENQKRWAHKLKQETAEAAQREMGVSGGRKGWNDRRRRYERRGGANGSGLF